MGENTSIEWADHTFNPWWGCDEVSPACDHCYAREFAKRLGMKLWGERAPRRFFGDSHWSEPVTWNRKAQAQGKRFRVFCASMADWLEDRPDLIGPRARLCRLIEDTAYLDWLMLTKRPENALRLVPETWKFVWPQNVWFGFTAEDQRRYDERFLHARHVPVHILFVSYEPALGPINFWLQTKTWGVDGSGVGGCGHCCNGDRCDDLSHHDRQFCPYCHGDGRAVKVKWVISGGESGARARPPHPNWFRSAHDQCQAAGTAFLFKQWGEWGLGLLRPSGTKGRFAIVADRLSVEVDQYPRQFEAFGSVIMERVGKKSAGRLLDGREWNEFPISN